MTRYYISKLFELSATDCYKLEKGKTYNYVWIGQRWEQTDATLESPRKYKEFSVAELFNLIKHEESNLGLKKELEVILKNHFYKEVLSE